jgi:hypothetical protein
MPESAKEMKIMLQIWVLSVDSQYVWHGSVNRWHHIWIELSVSFLAYTGGASNLSEIKNSWTKQAMNLHVYVTNLT